MPWIVNALPRPLALLAALVTRARIGSTVQHWAARRRCRVHLGRLGAEHLDDIGLDQQQAETECMRPFWR